MMMVIIIIDNSIDCLPFAEIMQKPDISSRHVG